jgi:Rrf2 family protein
MLKVPSRTKYAVNLLISLSRQGRAPVALSALAKENNISTSYGEQIFAKLRGAGMVVSTRGPGGGYRLGMELDQIKVYDVANLFAEAPELENEPTSVIEIAAAVHFSKVTIADLVRKELRQAA